MEFKHNILKLPSIRFSDRLILPDDPIFLVGSCFSEHVGDFLHRLYHPVVTNPMGIVFDPESLLLHFQSLEGKLEKEWVFRRDGVYFSWLYHSQMYGSTKDTLLEKISSARSKMNNSVASARLITITLGTAFNYRLVHDGIPVANCHKMPVDLFEKKLLNTNEIIHALNQIIAIVRRINPNVSIFITVSPVKHLRDGVVENSRSKAHLLSAAHQITESHNDVWYFPAYEIITDVLRNYEYYEEDMAHPTAKAVEVVFKHFLNTCFSNECQSKFNKIERFLKLLHHKVRIPEADSTKKWFENLHAEKEKIEKNYKISLSGIDALRWEALKVQFSDSKCA